MRIQVLGPGCKRSRKLLARTKEAVQELDLGPGVAVEEITDPDEIAGMGVLSAPGLAVDGRVVASGRVLSVREIREFLEKAGG
jgi:small redox-active disulfide protein 2